LKKIELDFLEKDRFTLRKHGKKILYYSLIFLFGFFIVSSIFYFFKSKSREKRYFMLKNEVAVLQVRVGEKEKKLKIEKAKITPEINLLNRAIERKAFSYTDTLWLLERALPGRSYITRITISSNGKVVLTGVFSSSSAIKNFMETLSSGGKYQVYLTREEMGRGGRTANIAWDLGGGE